MIPYKLDHFITYLSHLMKPRVIEIINVWGLLSILQYLCKKIYLNYEIFDIYSNLILHTIDIMSNKRQHTNSYYYLILVSNTVRFLKYELVIFQPQYLYRDKHICAG